MGVTPLPGQSELSGETEPDYRALYLAAQRRFERERRARQQAEAIAEQGLRDLHQQASHAALLGAVARAANSCSSLQQAMSIALAEICQHTGWVCGFVYVPDKHARLVLGPCRLVIGEGLEAFVEATQASAFIWAQGLPGRVAAQRRAIWLRDVADDDLFLRKSQAAACGLRAGIAFPVLIDGEVVAVTEFFAREAQAPDPVFIEVLDTIGVQLGRVVERERNTARLLHDATHDSLTGLPNRTHLLRCLTTRIAATGADEHTYAVVFVDLDRFKLVNDSLGHRAGDALLIEIARRFQETLATAATGGVLARLGGDEFVVLLESVPEESAATTFAEALLGSLAFPIEIDGQQLYGSASIGVTWGHFGYTSAEDVLRDADIAMYQAKRNGKGRIGTFEPQLHIQAIMRMALESDLRRALRNAEFVLHYQPIVPLRHGPPLGFEALIRWQRAPGVLVPPAAFVEVAEETGLIVFIGEFVLREASRAVVRWNRGRDRANWLSVSVNISVRQFQQPDFIQLIKRVLNETGAQPAMLRIELTESVAVTNFDQTTATMQALRDLGVRVSIDDFGTGHSSLSYLHQLPFDAIKLDRSFVQAMSDGGNPSEIVQAVLDLAGKLKVDVIAEGAETPEQMNELERIGCEFVQGFWVSRPLDEAGASAWLEAAGNGRTAAAAA